MNVLLTGATGFVGKGLLEYLSQNHSVTVALRTAKTGFQCSTYSIGEMDGYADWSHALYGQQVVIHAAARAHIMKDECSDPLEEYRRVNVSGTINLAKQAASAGVKRFIYISSIKVNGESTISSAPFKADDIPAPEDAYGISKFEAENALFKLASQTGMEVVVIRPPLIYGPHVKGNLANIIGLIDRGVPLPLGQTNNLRSFVALDNLVDLVSTCLDHPEAANQVFLVSDGKDLSTTDLIKKLAIAKGRAIRLFSVPESVLVGLLTLLGRKVIAQRLFGSLQVDIAKTRELLDWEPTVSVDEGFKRCFFED
ncbi:UDP-glucose 4-epimerase family protein [Neptuniibacter caesariensis]|uniref:UDP-glucose 4-epimerase, putative n=1 Tax=Neptuniibacter caesariensis TaxID=207954 RepID=A0A7U8C5K1_NEPCE|nr:SDR family oxidoreductase [Neptuniibacter caesariensis]EAR60515.1 UDP-glucose 4-epimerase, putative [Oceanospirillum sp. MED92] [Neptuniibacter caesariensis]